MLGRRILTSQKEWTTLIVQKRYRFKKKWAATRKKKTPGEQALNYFDNFYPSVYGDLWPSIRLALLSQQKYAALVNNFSSRSKDVIVDLITEGSDNFVKVASETDFSDEFQVSIAKSSTGRSSLTNMPQSHPPKSLNGSKESLNAGNLNSLKEDESSNREENISGGSESLVNFMPVKRVVSEKEELAKMEQEQALYSTHISEEGVEVLRDTQPLHLSHHLQCFTHPRGEIGQFMTPKKDGSDKLGYFLFDGASILPVIALGLCPGENVLDLCSAPGGKALTMLQTLLPDSVTCVDSSYSRLKRLRDMFHWYLPRSHTEEGMVRVVHVRGQNFCESRENNGDELYEKVLVDVPCFTDRHVVTQDDNNIFTPSRQRERLNLPSVQTDLLCSGLKLCKPGGSVVYSTCTLSVSQNEGVIEEAVRQFHETTNGQASVIDLGHIADRFRKTFNFFKHTKYGQLVIPNVTANFGPLYFCKLQRNK